MLRGRGKRAEMADGRLPSTCVPVWILLYVFLLAGCATVDGLPASAEHRSQQAVDSAAPASPLRVEPPLIAVLPFENLSANPAPLKEMRAALIKGLRKRGVRLLGEEALFSLMARNRIRYTGGVDMSVVEALQREAGVGGVMITSLGLYMKETPPKVVLMSRLARTGPPYTVLWADSVPSSGDDSPGFLGLGMVDRLEDLIPGALDGLADSLAGFLAFRDPVPVTRKTAARFRPKVFFRSPVLSGEKKYRVAVFPVVNQSLRKYAGELLALNIVERLNKTEMFEVLEPGFVRSELLRARIVAPEGASLDMANLLFSRLMVDLLFIGNVLEYQDIRGASPAAPEVSFSVQVIGAHREEVVCAANSTNRGDEGVFFFNVGRVRTAQSLALQMVAEVLERMRRGGAAQAGDPKKTVVPSP